MSVHFDPAARRWIAVYLSPGSAASDDGATSIRIRTARRLEGPWSPPRPLVSIPETTPRVGHPVDENLFCYAAKAHPQFSKPGHLLVTYVCNLFARTEEEVSPILERLRTSPELYRPRALEVAIPEDLIGSPP